MIARIIRVNEKEKSEVDNGDDGNCRSTCFFNLNIVSFMHNLRP